MTGFRLLLAAVLLLVMLPARAAFDHGHAAWTALLGEHVGWKAEGTATTVDYPGFAADHAELDRYLQSLAAVTRSQYDHWTWPQRQTFLINAYNAATVQLVLTGYPGLESIKDLGGLFSSPWKQEFLPLLGEVRSLDGIEHDLLRGADDYRDPRIHFAVNCASVGCPALRPQAYVAAQLDAQLQDQTTRFLRDRSRNRLRAGTPAVLALSPIFKWYADDFAARGGVVAFIADHADAIGANPQQVVQLRAGEVKLRYLDYDWSLNGRVSP